MKNTGICLKLFKQKNPISTVLLRCVKMKLWTLKFMAFLKLLWKQKDREVQYYHWLHHFRLQLFGTYYLLNNHSQNIPTTLNVIIILLERTLEDGTQQILSWKELHSPYILNSLTSSSHMAPHLCSEERETVNCSNGYHIYVMLFSRWSKIN